MTKYSPKMSPRQIQHWKAQTQHGLTNKRKTVATAQAGFGAKKGGSGHRKIK